MEGYGQPRWPAYFSGLGLDFVFLDGEHTPLNLETMAHACQSYAARQVAPLLRIPEPAPVWAYKALDMGAHGIIVPYVETVAQVKAMVGAVRYRPLKGAALQAVLDRKQFPSEDLPAYLDKFNEDSLLILMIESPTGVKNLPDLLAVEGVDAVLVGPHDMSVSSGVPEQYDSPEFEAQVRALVNICRDRGVAAGVHCIVPDPELALRWAGFGCNLIMYTSDTMFIIDGVKRGLQRMREALDGQVS